MTADERIACLEAQLADRDRAIVAMAEALRAANLRLQQEGDAARLLQEHRDAARIKKQRQRALRGLGVWDGRQDVSRDSGAVVSPGQSRDNEGTPLPPPLEGSPPPSVPSSPSPISSPPSSFSPSARPRNELRLETQQAPRKRAQKPPKPEKVTDPRHGPLSDAMVAAGWPHHGGRTGRAVSELLALADRIPPGLKPAEGAPAEVLRRAAIAKAHEGFPRVREVHELVTNWGHFERQPQSHRGPAPPSDFEKPREYVEPAWLDPNFGKE